MESKVLRMAFFSVMCAVLMSTLYFVFFGQGSWEGALFYATRQTEIPISKYYYTYCYLPNVHMNDAIDEALGGSIIIAVDENGIGDLLDTEPNLSTDDSSNVNFFSSGDHYSDGWH